MENLVDDYEEKIRKMYQKILDRSPDKKGLEHFLKLLKQKTMTIPQLEQKLKNSEEYKIGLLKPRNLELPTLERMKRDWNLRADVDANYYVIPASKTEKEFWQSGWIAFDRILKENTNTLDFLNALDNPKNMNVLEIGCGVGRILIPLSKFFGHVYGVDVSEKMILHAKENVAVYPNINVFSNNGDNLSMFDDEFFHLCCSYIVFQHIPEKQIISKYIQEVSRILKKGGIFRFQVHGDTKINPTDGSTWRGVHFTSSEIHRFAKENHFKILEEAGEKVQYYLLTFQKN